MTKTEQAAFDAIQQIGKANHELALTLAAIAGEHRAIIGECSRLTRKQKQALRAVHDRTLEVAAASLGMARITLGPQ